MAQHGPTDQRQAGRCTCGSGQQRPDHTLKVRGHHTAPPNSDDSPGTPRATRQTASRHGTTLGRPACNNTTGRQATIRRATLEAPYADSDLKPAPTGM